MTTRSPNHLSMTEVVVHFAAHGDNRNYPHSAVLNLSTGEVKVSFEGYNEPPDLTFKVAVGMTGNMMADMRYRLMALEIPEKFVRRG